MQDNHYTAYIHGKGIISYRNIKLGEVSSPPPPAMYSSLYLKKNKYKFAKKKKCNSSMTMHAILNVLRIVLLNIVYNGTMRFTMYIST